MNKRSAHRARPAALLAAAISVMGVTQIAQGITATWVSAASGTWNIASNWSTNPEFPNNDSPNPGDVYDAVIGATGAIYTVSLDSNITVNSLTLNAGSATFQHTAGTLTTNSLNLQAGTYLLNGTIRSATISSSGGTLMVPATQSGRLDAVTLNTDLVVDSATLVISNGLTLNNRTVTLASNPNFSTGLSFQDGSTLGGSGTIEFGGAINGQITGVGYTIGSNIRVQTGTAGGQIDLGNGGTNQGVISAQTSDQTIRIDGMNWNNTGTLRAANGATISLQGTVANGGLGTLVNAGGTIELGSTFVLDNAGHTQSFNVPVYFYGGAINGGTINLSGAGTILLGSLGARLDGVTLDSDLTITGGGITIQNSLTLNNRTVTLKDGGHFTGFTGSSFAGTGTIVSNQSVENGASQIQIGDVGAGIFIRTGSADLSVLFATNAVNHGTISADGAGRTLIVSGTNWSNTGTLKAANGATLSLQGTFPGTGLGNLVNNGGTIELGANSNIDNTNNNLTFTVPIHPYGATITGGSLSLSGAGTLLIDHPLGLTLDGVTVNADLSASSTGILSYRNGLVLNNRTITLNGGQLAGNADAGLVSGTGTIAFVGDYGQYVVNSGTAPFGIGPSITLVAGADNGVVNLGFGGTNQGTISVSAGKNLNISGSNWTNTGRIIAGSGAFISLGGEIPVNGLGTLINNGGTIELGANSVLQNTGNNLVFTTPVSIYRSTIVGGSISLSGAGTLLLDKTHDVTLDGVTINANLSANGFDIKVFNGLTLNSRTITLNSDPTGFPSRILVRGTPGMIGGTGTILFTGEDFGQIGPLNSNADSLIVGPNIRIATGNATGSVDLGIGGTNQGTLIAASPNTLNITGAPWTNSGTIAASNGGTALLMALPTNYSNGLLTGGHYVVMAGSTIDFGASTITTNAADVRLDGAGSRFDAINALSTNSGTFTVANGRAFNFAGPVSNTATGRIIAASGGSIGINGGSNSGTIESQTGGTIVFNGNFNHLANSFLRGSGKVLFNAGIQDFFGNVVGDIDLNITGGQANFRAGSSTSVNLLNISTNNTILEAGATLNVGPGGLNLTGNSSPAVALGAGASGAKITLASGNVSVTGSTTAQILSSGSGAADGVLDLGGTARTFTVADGAATPDLLVTARVINGGLTKSGPGTMSLTNSNTYSAGTNISNGTLQISNINALGGSAVSFMGGTLDIRSDQANTTLPNPLWAQTPTTSIFLNVDRLTGGTPGSLQMPAAILGSNLTVTGAGTALFAGAALTNDVVIENFTTTEINGTIGGNFGITRGGSGISNGALILSGNSANTYSGTTSLLRGKLVLNKSLGNAIPHNLHILRNTVEYNASNQIADNATVFLNSGGFDSTLDLGAFSDTIGGLVSNNNVIAGGDLTVTGTTSWSGGNMVGPGKLIIPSTGVATLFNYFGDRPVENSGSFTFPDGFGAAGLVFTNQAGGTVTSVNSGGFNFGYSGAFDNRGTYTKQGAGSTAFSSTMSFFNSGTITVNAGTLSIFGNGSNTGTIDVAAGATIQFGRITLASGSTLRGAGAFQFTNQFQQQTIEAGAFTPQGPVLFNSFVQLNGPLTLNNLTIGGGEVYGPGDLNLAGSTAFNGGIIHGAGRITNSATGVATIANYTLARFFDNSGTINFVPGGGFQNAGYLTNLAGGVMTAQGSGVINRIPGATVTNAGTFNKIGAGTFTVNGAASNSGVVNISSGTLEFAISFTNTGTIKTTGNGPSAGVLRLALTNLDPFNNAGTINISGGGMVFDHFQIANPLDPVRAQIITGYANGAWNGPGIKSTAAGANPLHSTGLGYASATALGIVGSGSFMGGTVDDSSVLVRYTLLGDANLDGTVNTQDFDRLAINFNATAKLWSDGDSNYDGRVNALDFNAIATNFGSILPGDLPILGAPALGTLVPEPASLAGLIAIAVLYRRRRTTSTSTMRAPSEYAQPGM